MIYNHGFLDCFVGVISTAEESLGLKLVNAGYDLWLNNNRGTRYSKDHERFDLEHCSDEHLQEYWDFSLDEYGKYDQPALWDYITSVTGESKMTYIGHSQGCGQFYAALCEKPDFFRDRLKLFVSIAPAVFLGSMTCEIVKKHGDKL